jgi:hypothetical protein
MPEHRYILWVFPCRPGRHLERIGVQREGIRLFAPFLLFFGDPSRGNGLFESIWYPGHTSRSWRRVCLESGHLLLIYLDSFQNATSTFRGYKENIGKANATLIRIKGVGYQPQGGRFTIDNTNSYYAMKSNSILSERPLAWEIVGAPILGFSLGALPLMLYLEL